ncbi:MAG: NAD(P)-dependent alcohol dehydrogenase [Leptolyngbyaceae bacterium]|nr:NAD(P)-dependent alcohol dehydrogenase [Leptolyngbyaceae bacterium]
MSATKSHIPSSTTSPVHEKTHQTMKAIARSEYGSADVLRLETVNKPAVPEDGVLIRVQATSINAGDCHLMRGTPLITRVIYGGLRKPKIQILGFDVAGRVEAVGQKVTQFKPGDEVFGDLSECGFGAFAEYVCAAESSLVLKPDTISFETAAAVSGAALPALQGLRDCGQIQPRQKVLINGASGGVGSFAVQIAKALGAEVTALCSTEKMDKVRLLGADHVIDYTQVDVTQSTIDYDLILDAAAYRSVFDYFSILKPGGTYVLVGGSISRLFQVMFFGTLISKVSRRRVNALVSTPKQSDLYILKDWLVSGAIAPLIDQIYSLENLPSAVRKLEQRQVTGKVVVRV